MKTFSMSTFLHRFINKFSGKLSKHFFSTFYGSNKSIKDHLELLCDSVSVFYVELVVELKQNWMKWLQNFLNFLLVEIVLGFKNKNHESFAKLARFSSSQHAQFER